VRFVQEVVEEVVEGVVLRFVGRVVEITQTVSQLWVPLSYFSTTSLVLTEV
jgi:hypothetical protein